MVMSEKVCIGGRRGKSIILRSEVGPERAEFPWPGDGEWVLCPSSGISAYTGQEVMPCAAIVRVEGGALVATLRAPTEDEFRPARDLSLADLEAFTAGLSDAQLRRTLAWLIWQHRGSLPEDIRSRIAEEGESP